MSPRRAALAGLCVAVAAPASAQMAGMHMPGMAMPASAKPAPAKKKAAAKPAKPAPRPAAPPPPAYDMANMPGMAMPGMSMPPAGPATATSDCPPEHAAMGHCKPAPAPAAAAGTDLPAGNAPPPAPPVDRAADRYYPPAAMARANAMMRGEHGGMAVSKVMLNLAEAQVRDGRDGYRWLGEAWFGGDLHRLVLKSEGEGDFRRHVDKAEVQALYGRAIGPYFDLQAGVRQDLGAGARRTYATVGVEGLAPYWLEVEAALFLSDHGDVLGRVEGYYDQRITQRLILQPRAELEFAAQDVPESRIGSGLSRAELGLRLRYEIAREFAPYVGVSWDRRIGASGRFARLAGEERDQRALVLGVRTWF